MARNSDQRGNWESPVLLLGFPCGSVVNNLLPIQETQMWVPLLGQEDPLEEEMATHFRVLA